MKKNKALRKKRAGLFITAAVIGILGACTNTVQPKADDSKAIPAPGSALHMKNMEGTVPIRTIEAIPYVSANDVSRVLGFRMRWDAPKGSILLGDEDASYELHIGSTAAVKGGSAMNIPQSPILSHSQAFIPVTSLGSLFQDDIRFDVEDEQTVRFIPVKPIAAAADSGTAAEFADDPISSVLPEGGREGAVAKPKALAYRAKSLQQQDEARDSLIQKAQRYLGVSYEFGAEPYSESGTFDCSSFTKYLFERHGIQLGRTARQQADQGTPVSEQQLRKGDLLFFTVPGRFTNEKEIGHVAIYLGNHKVIHALPDNGVQITDIDKPLWKSRFVKARRYLP